MAVLALSLLLPTAVRSEDWPQWRGPNRDGVWNETGVVESFPSSGLKIFWRAPAGPGWSSPIVAQGRVYVTDVELARPTAKERMLCFNESNGKLLWSRSYAVDYPDLPGHRHGQTGLADEHRDRAEERIEHPHHTLR